MGFFLLRIEKLLFFFPALHKTKIFYLSENFQGRNSFFFVIKKKRNFFEPTRFFARSLMWISTWDDLVKGCSASFFDFQFPFIYTIFPSVSGISSLFLPTCLHLPCITKFKENKFCWLCYKRSFSFLWTPSFLLFLLLKLRSYLVVARVLLLFLFRSYYWQSLFLVSTKG